MTAARVDAGKEARRAWLRALEATASLHNDPQRTLPVVIDDLAQRFADAPALLCRSTSLSHQGLAALAHRVARWGLVAGLKRGDVVGLLMPNRAAYPAIWLGLTRIGVTVALLNNRLTAASLAHSIRAAGATAVIVDGSQSRAWDTVNGQFDARVRRWCYGDGGDEGTRIDQLLEGLSDAPLTSREAPLPQQADRALYIYTSGTTGLPKAATISHGRVMQWSHWFAGLMNASATDRLYNCLPFSHSIGGIVAIFAPLIAGGSVVVRERFSAREFWADVVGERCTLFQYIGELCRYLVNLPATEAERSHRLRLCCGNGLRADIWRRFQERFQVPQILEYYAATEASFSLYNCEGKVGAIGRVPPFLTHRVRVELVRIDPDNSEPLRDAAGRCLAVATHEAGEAIGPLRNAGVEVGRFEGYADTEASRRKLLHDVFEPGDLWYRSGDLMRQDEQGFFYFVDRLGDTFRWKGENISTTEVAGVFASLPGVSEVAVYGVIVSGSEGRAGMAALVVNQSFNLEEIRRLVSEQLPEYAQPVFLRLVPTIDMTGTFRLNKRELMLQGYDPAVAGSNLYFNDRARRAYVALDEALHARIRDGDLSL